VARSGVVDEYRAVLAQAIERNWIRPPSARAGLECTLFVTQATGGTVVDVKLGACNGDQTVRESIVNAVYRASPLPAPRDPRAFERRLEIVFKPTE
jgi:colicin import membrane protein